MSTTKHTLGPWQVGHFGDVRSTDGYHSLASVSSHNELPAEANAHLMAAAPELLEALQLIVAKCELPDRFDGLTTISVTLNAEQVLKVRAAIAKATQG